MLSDGRFAAVFQRGRLIFQVIFYADNFLRSRMKIHSWKDSNDTEFVNSEVRRALDLMNKTDVMDAELEDRTRKEIHSQFEKQAKELASDISRLLPTFARIFSEGGIIIGDLGNRNKVGNKLPFLALGEECLDAESRTPIEIPRRIVSITERRRDRNNSLVHVVT